MLLNDFLRHCYPEGRCMISYFGEKIFFGYPGDALKSRKFNPEEFIVSSLNFENHILYIECQDVYCQEELALDK